LEILVSIGRRESPAKGKGTSKSCPARLRKPLFWHILRSGSDGNAWEETCARSCVQPFSAGRDRRTIFLPGRKRHQGRTVGN